MYLLAANRALLLPLGLVEAWHKTSHKLGKKTLTVPGSERGIWIEEGESFLTTIFEEYLRH